eukprot:COSAG01_NODE_4586_length_4894_cov_6.028989_1_plen_178_part_00
MGELCIAAASGWDGVAAPEVAHRGRQPSAACSSAARGDVGVLMGGVLKRGGAQADAWMAGKWWHRKRGWGESAPMRGGQPGACADVGSPHPLVSVASFPCFPFPFCLGCARCSCWQLLLPPVSVRLSAACPHSARQACGGGGGRGTAGEICCSEKWISGGNCRNRVLKKIGHNCSSG